jgi:hypothetical protein
LTLPVRLAVAVAAVAAFVTGYIAPASLHARSPALVFDCPRTGESPLLLSGDLSQVAARARRVEVAALRRSGGTADSASAPEVIAVIAIGRPGIDPSSTGTLFFDARRRCPRVRAAWAIVAFRRSGAADACCLDTIFVAPDGRRWFVF